MKNQKPVALLSAFNKEGLPEFARSLCELGWELYASGGTARELNAQGLPTTDIASIVGKPILGHRVVTLSREIHAALLATNSPEDVAELASLGIPRIELVYVDLYPLESTIAAGGALEQVIEKTDIGGPTMLRSAAKGRRIVLHHRSQFGDALAFIEHREYMPADDVHGVISKFASEAERRVAEYCMASAKFHEKRAAILLGNEV